MYTGNNLIVVAISSSHSVTGRMMERGKRGILTATLVTALLLGLANAALLNKDSRKVLIAVELPRTTLVRSQISLDYI